MPAPAVEHLQVVKGARKGASKRAVVCGKCGCPQLVACDPDRPGQALKKATDGGWLLRGSGVSAPPPSPRVETPVEKEPAPMAAPEPKPAISVVPKAPREPTTDQRRAILAELDGACDRPRERYCGVETDATVAKRVGGVPLAWVAQIRKLMFGPTRTTRWTSCSPRSSGTAGSSAPSSSAA
jgi:hypothetical protein